MYIDILDLEIEDSQQLKLNKYLDTLLFWQKSINLISNDTIKDAKLRHFYDSLQLLKHLRNLEVEKGWSDKSINIFDLGSGAGFPSLVLAIFDSKNQYYLIESNSKKASFLLEIVRSLELTNVVVVNKRIEDFYNNGIKANIVISRGLTKLVGLVEASKNLGFHDVICMFLKGESYMQEIDDLLSKNTKSSLDISTFESLTNKDSRIIIIKNL
jgi:16S rRNA (guanine527-N7)-methyltransferase